MDVVIYKEIFRFSPVKKVIEHLIDLNLKKGEEGNYLRVELIKL